MVAAQNESERARLERLIREVVLVMAVLRAARRVNLPDWYVGFEFLRYQ